MQTRILVVDDEEMITDSISSFLELATDYEVLTSNSPEGALDFFRQNPCDLVISDFLMPKLNGLEFLKGIKSIKEDTVLILLTGYADKENAIKAINELGIYYYVEKPWSNQDLLHVINNGIEKKKLADSLKDTIVKLEHSNQKIEELFGELKKEYEQEKDNLENVMVSLAKAIEAKDAYTEHHVERVSSIAMYLAQRLNLDDKDVSIVKIAAAMHDIGKIGIPESVLNKPGRLTEEEFEIIKNHPVIGERICSPLKTVKNTIDIIKHHHEKLDGSGYPDGLKGDEISVGARIVAVADIFDALYSERPYRSKLSLPECIRIIEDEASKDKLDKDVVRALLQLLKEGDLIHGLYQ